MIQHDHIRMHFFFGTTQQDQGSYQHKCTSRKNISAQEIRKYQFFSYETTYSEMT